MEAIRFWLPRPTRRKLIAGAILFFSYLIIAYIGGKLFVAPAVIVPAAGVAVAGLVLEGVSTWPAIYLAALALGLISDYSLFTLLILPIAQTLQALAAAFVLKELDFDPLMRRLRDMFSIIGMALTASVIVPTFGFFALYLNGLILGQPLLSTLTWGSWWTGQILSLLVVAPFIIRWVAEPYFYRLPVYRHPARVAEILGVLTLILTLNWMMSFRGVIDLSGINLVYFLLVPLFWLAIRIGPRFTILGILATTIITIGGAYYGPVVPNISLGIRVFQLEVFLIIISMIFYIIAGLQEERTEAIKSLTSYIARLEDALNRLSLQDRAKNDFIAVLAHELRNPLAPIVSALELIRINYPMSGEGGEALDLMDDRLRTIQRLLDDLLDISRISRSKLRIKKAPVELQVIIDHSVRAIDRLLGTRRQKLVLSLPEKPVLLNADAVRLEQVITNLLTNASKFTPHGGRIEVAAQSDTNMAEVRVSDNGIGIDPQMLEKIFEPFLQLETGDHKGEGLGIGLSLTQRLVEMHDGTIEAYSAGPNEGSTFIVRLPVMQKNDLREVREAPKMPEPVRDANPDREIHRVLVVDDNTAAALGIGKLLEHKGYEVSCAYNGTDAREIATQWSPNAIVLDIGLPDMDGYDLARILRLEMGYTGLIIALTGYGQEEDKQRARDAGFNHHLTKPISINELEAVLKQD
jgi:signal transduction histidine kinase/CheY-like chemotaxis protein